MRAHLTRCSVVGLEQNEHVDDVAELLDLRLDQRELVVHRHRVDDATWHVSETRCTVLSLSSPLSLTARVQPV